MGFFQPKNNMTIRKNKDKIKHLNNKNSNLNSYQISSKFIDASDIITKSLEKKSLQKNILFQNMKVYLNLVKVMKREKQVRIRIIKINL